MTQYPAALRASPTCSGISSLVARDQGWMVKAWRAKTGIPVDHETAAALSIL
jgi:hypothetical protein